MKRLLIRAVVAVSLVLGGWIAGRAQTRTPDFSVSIDAPAGETRLVCTQGCVLQGGRDLGIGEPLKEMNRTYIYRCGNADRCKGTANGWIVR